MVSPAGIEHDEGDRWAADRPLPPQPIPILSGLVKFGGPLHVYPLAQNAIYPVMAPALIVGLKRTVVRLRSHGHRGHDRTFSARVSSVADSGRRGTTHTRQTHR